MKATDLKGRAVVTLSNAAKVGTIDEILFDGRYRQVMGFAIKRGTFSGRTAVARGSVTAIGRDAITLPGPDVIDASARPTAMTGTATLAQIHGTKVVSQGGEFLGTIEDVDLDDAATSVQAYILTAPLLDRLRHRQRRLAAQDVLSIGAGRIMTVPNNLAEDTPPRRASNR